MISSNISDSRVVKAGFKRYLCVVCGHIYDEEVGDLDSGISPGTLWEDIPADWFCPECNAGKSDFTLLEC